MVLRCSHGVIDKFRWLLYFFSHNCRQLDSLKQCCMVVEWQKFRTSHFSSKVFIMHFYPLGLPALPPTFSTATTASTFSTATTASTFSTATTASGTARLRKGQ